MFRPNIIFRRILLRQNHLSRPSESTKGRKLILGQSRSRTECSQYGERSTSRSLWNGDLGAVGATARDLGVGDVGDHVDQANVEWCVGIDRHEECARVVGELELGAGWGRGLEVWWRSGCHKRELWQDGDRELLRALDDESLSEIVGEDGSQCCVKRGGEWRGADTGSEVGVVARLDCEDAAGCSEECGVVCEKSGSSKVCTDADRCDHVGEVNERGGRVVWEHVGAWRDGSIASVLEDCANGRSMGDFVLLKRLVRLEIGIERRPYRRNHANVLTESRREASGSVLSIREVLIATGVESSLKVFQIKSQLKD